MSLFIISACDDSEINDDNSDDTDVLSAFSDEFLKHYTSSTTMTISAAKSILTALIENGVGKVTNTDLATAYGKIVAEAMNNDEDTTTLVPILKNINDNADNIVALADILEYNLEYIGLQDSIDMMRQEIKNKLIYAANYTAYLVVKYCKYNGYCCSVKTSNLLSSAVSQVEEDISNFNNGNESQSTYLLLFNNAKKLYIEAQNLLVDYILKYVDSEAEVSKLEYSASTGTPSDVASALRNIASTTLTTANSTNDTDIYDVASYTYTVADATYLAVSYLYSTSSQPQTAVSNAEVVAHDYYQLTVINDNIIKNIYYLLAIFIGEYGYTLPNYDENTDFYTELANVLICDNGFSLDSLNVDTTEFTIESILDNLEASIKAVYKEYNIE